MLTRVAQPHVQSYQFQKLIERQIRNTRPRPDAARMHHLILEQGRAMGVKVADDDIQVESQVRGYQVNVRYAIPMDLRFYRADVPFFFTAHTADDE